MRTLPLIILLFLGESCNNDDSGNLDQKTPDNSRLVTLKFSDSLGNVTLSVPMRYDTMFSWTHHSDCGPPCDKIKYRLQPKTLPIFKESGFYYRELEDSIEQLTIVHSGDLRFSDNMDSSYAYVKKLQEMRIKELLADAGTYKIQFDTLERINDRYFSIIVIDLFDSAKKQFSRKVLAVTTIRGNGVGFDFELLTKREDSTSHNFIKNSMQLVRTIKISNGK